MAVLEKTVFVKIPGRANFNSSLDLKSVYGELRQKGFANFVFDLRECVTMDSTFLGVLAGLVLRPPPAPPQTEKACVALLNPNPRVADLIENLGVLDLFQVKQDPTPCTLAFEPSYQGPAPTKEQITRNCLQAHQTLMEINPENIPKFKEVTAFMAEDLKKMASGQG